MNHYERAKEILEDAQKTIVGDREGDELRAEAQVHATLYVGEQLETLAGVLGAQNKA